MVRMPSGARCDARNAPNTAKRAPNTAKRAPNTTTKRLASIATAADAADVSTRTIRRWIADGRLIGYRVGPRLVKVDLGDLDTLVRRIPTAGDAA